MGVGASIQRSSRKSCWYDGSWAPQRCEKMAYLTRAWTSPCERCTMIMYRSDLEHTVVATLKSSDGPWANEELRGLRSIDLGCGHADPPRGQFGIEASYR